MPFIKQAMRTECEPPGTHLISMTIRSRGRVLEELATIWLRSFVSEITGKPKEPLTISCDSLIKRQQIPCEDEAYRPAVSFYS